MEKDMLIHPDYTPIQFIVPDDKQCESIIDRWRNIYYTNKDEYSYISHLSLARTYNLIYTFIKTDKLTYINFPYTEVPTSSAENIEFYKLNKNLYLILKEENHIQEMADIHGSQFWFKNGNLHRDNDLPAAIYHDRSQVWYQNGLIHRDNNFPAIIYSSGARAWYKNGEQL